MTSLVLNDAVRIGFMAGFADAGESRRTIELAERLDYDSLWVGDHVAFPVPILDPLIQLSMAAALSDSLLLGTCVFLLPLRHPTPVAKQVATLDRLSEGRLIFGVGVGGEFPNEYAACGVPVGERGARLGESITVLKKLWSGDEVSHDGRFYPLDRVRMLPAPRQLGGPRIWCGGRSSAALVRAGRQADGYISYAVTPGMFSERLETITAAARNAGRCPLPFGTAHMLFIHLDDDPDLSHRVATEHLSQRYAMDFSKPAARYGALGPAEQVAARINEYIEAGVRHFVLDLTCPGKDRAQQLTRFSTQVRPLIRSL